MKNNAPTITAWPTGPLPWVRGQLHAIATRLLISSRFQKLATRFWFTRWIARKRASELFDLCSGFVYSQILSAAVQVKLFDHLRNEPKTAVELAQSTGLTLTATTRLLRATNALNLTKEVVKHHYGLGKLGAAFVSQPGMADLTRHHAMFYRDLADPVALLNDAQSDSELRQFWPYSQHDDSALLAQESVANYSSLMAESQPMICEQILGAYPLQNHHHIMDVGGGTGRFLSLVGARHPHLQLQLLDLPAVVEGAEFPAGLNASKHGINFLQEALPKGADVISLVRILHDHDDAAVKTLLQSCHDALPKNGTLLIAEPLAETRGAERMGDAYFNFYFLAMNSGLPRTKKTLSAMLQEAGFTQIKSYNTTMPLICSVLAAKA